MKLAILACVFAIATVPLARAADITITGLDTGISPDQAKAIIGSGYTFHTWPGSAPHFMLETAYANDKSNVYALDFGDNKLWYIAHVIEFKAGGLPDAQTLANQVMDKYGRATDGMPQVFMGQWRGIWIYSASGHLMTHTFKFDPASQQENAIYLACLTVSAQMTWGAFPIPDEGLSPQPPRSYSSACHKIVVADYGISTDHTLGSLEVDLVDDQAERAAVEALTAEQTAAAQAALKKAQAVKPSL